MATPDDTEAQFYEALQRADLEQVMAVWADDEEIACISPGGPRQIGAAAIRGGFEEIFAQGGVNVRVVQVRRVVVGGCAVHHVLEEVRVPTEQGTHAGYVVATNLYAKTTQGWKLLVHHASPGGPAELLEFRDPSAIFH
ncbi:YybH family protein [Sphaerotilus hippei]|nr:nuclear transport factor 2 family protein [Sphaerotilus hippei]